MSNILLVIAIIFLGLGTVVNSLISMATFIRIDQDHLFNIDIEEEE